jgi:hypothetical protein
MFLPKVNKVLYPAFNKIFQSHLKSFWREEDCDFSSKNKDIIERFRNKVAVLASKRLQEEMVRQKTQAK